MQLMISRKHVNVGNVKCTLISDVKETVKLLPSTLLLLELLLVLLRDHRVVMVAEACGVPQQKAPGHEG